MELHFWRPYWMRRLSHQIWPSHLVAVNLQVWYPIPWAVACQTNFWWKHSGRRTMTWWVWVACHHHWNSKKLSCPRRRSAHDPMSLIWCSVLFSCYFQWTLFASSDDGSAELLFRSNRHERRVGLASCLFVKQQLTSRTSALGCSLKGPSDSGSLAQQTHWHYLRAPSSWWSR